jgi:hypothetical protein
MLNARDNGNGAGKVQIKLNDKVIAIMAAKGTEDQRTICPVCGAEKKTADWTCSACTKYIWLVKRAVDKVQNRLEESIFKAVLVIATDFLRLDPEVEPKELAAAIREAHPAEYKSVPFGGVVAACVTAKNIIAKEAKELEGRAAYEAQKPALWNEVNRILDENPDYDFERQPVWVGEYRISAKMVQAARYKREAAKERDQAAKDRAERKDRLVQTLKNLGTSKPTTRSLARGETGGAGPNANSGLSQFSGKSKTGKQAHRFGKKRVNGPDEE